MSRTGNAVSWLTFFVVAASTAVQLPGLAGDFFYEVGAQRSREQNYRRAAGAFRMAAFLKPGNARAHIELGSTLLRVKDYEGAEVSFTNAQNIREESCALCGLGSVYSETGRYEEAERAFRRAAELNPNDACAYEWSGRMFYRLERYEEAARAFAHELRLRPDAVVSLHFLGNSYGYLGRHREAAELYRRIIRLRPDYGDAHYQLGVSYSYLNRHRDAVASYRRALELEPVDGRAVYGLALAHAALGETRSATAYHERLRSLDPAAAAELSQRLGRREARRQR